MLSFFDGIGTILYILKLLHIQPLAIFTWETDEECMALTSALYPDVRHRGDMDLDNYDQLLTEMDEVDPTQTAGVLIAAGPPCPDYSVIKTNSPGRFGAEGRKFDTFCDIVEYLEANMYRKTQILVENVIPKDHRDALHFCDRLKARCVIADSKHLKVVGRPRIWWQRINWERTPLTLHAQIKWQTKNQFQELVLHPEGAQRILPMQSPLPEHIDTGNLVFHPDILGGLGVMPCLLTPAPDVQKGRSAPAGSLESVTRDAAERWRADRQQYAPWNYSDQAMLVDHNGNRHLPTPEIKEQMHLLPVGYTSTVGSTTHKRHTMLGNGWHAGIASAMTILVLASRGWITEAQTQQTNRHESQAIYRRYQQHCATLPLQIRTRPLDAAAFAFRALMHNRSYGPTPKNKDTFSGTDADSWEVHMDLMSSLYRSATTRSLDESSRVALDLANWDRQGIAERRRAVTDDIQTLCDEWSDKTQAWRRKLPHHVRMAYTGTAATTDVTADIPVTNVPVMLHLLQLLGYPQLDELGKHLNEGFAMLGSLHPGVDWQPRSDEWYSSPMSTGVRHSQRRVHTRIHQDETTRRVQRTDAARNT